MKTKYLKIKDNSLLYLIQIWDRMNDIVFVIKNKKIFNYWKQHGVPIHNGKPVKYDIFANNPYSYGKYFEESNFDDIYRAFVHCCCMSIDKDVPEYLNCLDAMGEIKHKENL